MIHNLSPLLVQQLFADRYSKDWSSAFRSWRFL